MLTSLALVFVAILCAGIPASVAAYDYFLKELPAPETIATRDSFKTARILDRRGRLLYEILDPNGGRRTVVPLSQIAEPMRWATVAVEDSTFYVNPGFDLRGIGRALWLNIRGNQVMSGASTITQQLVKNTLLSNEVSFERKLKEAVLAWEVSRRYSKDQILEMYLNEIYYGNMAYGVEAAAQTYFGKFAKDLSLAEGSLLAGLVQSPADYDPFTNLPDAKERQTIVLDLMAKYEFITRGEAEAAKAERLALRRRSEAIAVPLLAPHFALHVLDLVERSYGENLLYRGGLVITTTLDLDLQQIAEEAMREHLAKIKRLNVTNGALVAIDPRSGEIVAMVGSANYFDDSIDGQVNVALSKRQAGSTLKPFVYLTAFGKGATPASIVQDTPTDFGSGYRPQNHDKKFRGPVRARPALAGSLNIPAVKMLEIAGLDNAAATLTRAGITDLSEPRRYGLTLALGSAEVKLLDLTFAYATLANNGLQIGERDPNAANKADWRTFAPVAVQRILDAEGRAIYEYLPPPGKQVLDPQLSYLITSILSDDIAREGTFGRHSFLELSREAAAKTGTTDDFRDGWTVGYTPDLVAGVWVGNADNTRMLDVYGVSGAGYIWHNFMERALDSSQHSHGLEPPPFERPAGIQEIAICADTGEPAKPGCVQMKEVFANSMVSKLATPVPPAAGGGPPKAEITSPARGSAVVGVVAIEGSATGKLNPSYALEYSPASSVDQWTIIAARPFSVENSFLGRWATTQVPSGDYRLRLNVKDSAGNTATSSITVSVSSPWLASPTAVGRLAPIPSTPAATASPTATKASPTAGRAVTTTATPSSRQPISTATPTKAAQSTPTARR